MWPTVDINLPIHQGDESLAAHTAQAEPKCVHQGVAGAQQPCELLGISRSAVSLCFELNAEEPHNPRSIPSFVDFELNWLSDLLFQRCLVLNERL